MGITSNTTTFVKKFKKLGKETWPDQKQCMIRITTDYEELILDVDDLYGIIDQLWAINLGWGMGYSCFMQEGTVLSEWTASSPLKKEDK